ncbi:MAG TPA: 4-alpha-glucanotransferase [Rhizomicrobium sp.]|jgi:4-alpha-glucanotransferase|nr:4-alpha-glucanotransferase [Rhizomicrobium sp.]
MSKDRAVTALATRAGLEVNWIDAKGTPRTVSADTLRAVLRALELPADNASDIAASEASLRREAESNPPLIVARPGDEVCLPNCRRAELILNSGQRRDLQLREGLQDRMTFVAPRGPGYHRLEMDEGVSVLAVAPARCVLPDELGSGDRLAGTVVQIYSLRGGTSGAFGDFSALGWFAMQAGRLGLDAVMTSPTHALLGADPAQFQPYSASTRLFLNPLFADATLEGGPALTDPGDAELIDWRAAGDGKLAALHIAFERFCAAADQDDFRAFCRTGGERLSAHALFESLDGHFRGQGISGFTKWPTGFHSPAAPCAVTFARVAAREIEFQLFLQWLTDRSAADAQRAARRTMAIGIISDIAAGMTPQGSHAWSAPRELLCGLHVGAPPDIFNPRGQDWGLTALSQRALQQLGYAPFLATLRAAMRHAGGVRIDHAMGLRRLWVIPAGASPSDGVYLRYPQQELLGLIALESRLHRAIVVGEDLGTVPEGFREQLDATGVLGMQVLWFERHHDGHFLAPHDWRRSAVAMTTTHDLPTVAGWWSERDIDWQQRTGRLRATEEKEREDRAADRELLWSDLRRAGCASGDPPAADAPEDAISGALAFVGKTPCMLAVAPAEDIAGDRDQPNLPGTIDEHPNWRRRMPKGDLLQEAAGRARLTALMAGRRSR